MDFLNHDQGIGELLMKPDPNAYRFEPGYALPRTTSSPPASKSKPAGESGSRKRKADQTQNPKAATTEEDSKSCTGASGSTITNNNNNKGPSNSKGSNDAPKPDYIHVRARRGQATDSHSLAERVRREKISERMKYLQDLVPGCNRITGKAGMLDEIINYVQSLQRQVEFLSMKLASINSSPDFDIEGYLAKEIFAPQAAVNPATTQFSTFGHGALDSTIVDMDAILRRTISAPVSITDTFLESSSLNQIQQITPWEDELQNFYQQQPRFTPFTGCNESGHVKLEMWHINTDRRQSFRH